jgi:cholesterol transport system auxiliary component
MNRSFFLPSLVLVCGLAACSAVPEKPTRANLYDFGPVSAAAAETKAPALPPLVLAEVEAVGALDGTAMLYRLGYADDHELRPYAQARWSASPAQLVRQRLRLQLGRDRAVLDTNESASLARTGRLAPRVLHVEVEEFSHWFESQTASWGLLRLRATVLDNSPAGEHLLAQRSFVVRKPARAADAAGGAEALAAATDDAAEQIRQWLASVQ